LQVNSHDRLGQKTTILHELLGMPILIIEQEQQNFSKMQELLTQNELHDQNEKAGIMLRSTLLRMDSKHNKSL